MKVQSKVIAYSLHGRDGRHLGIIGINEARASLVFGYAIAVGRDAEAGAGLRDVKPHAVLRITQLIVVRVVRIEVVISLKTGHKGLVSHRTGHAFGALAAQYRPSEEDGVADRELILRSVGDIVCLEGIVLNQLGADASVHGLVDILEKDACQGRAYLYTELARIEVESAALGLLEPLQLEHLVRHPVAHEAHALRAEMELVASALATQGGNDVCVGHYLRQMGQHHFVEGRTDTVLLGVFQFAGKQGNGIGVQAKVGAEVVMDLLDTAGPLGIVRIGLPLMHQHTLYHTVLLSFACGLHQPLVRTHPIFPGHVYEPSP